MKGALLLAGLLACLGSAARAQTTSTCQPFTTLDSSTAWLTQISRQPLPQQVAAVRERAACDANVYDSSRDLKICFMGISQEGRHNYERYKAEHRRADTRPNGITLLYMIDGCPLETDSVACSVQRLVVVSSVKTIKFLSGISETCIYGTSGASGVVVITTKHPH